jgi:type IX secretion system PorP/SprF family membrane protein
MKLFNTALICTFISGVVNGQQDIQFTQAMSNPYLFNVGAGGMTNVAEFNLGTRAQWLSVDGKPMTYYASGQSQIRFGKADEPLLDEFNKAGKSVYDSPARTIGLKHVIGGKAISDVIGPFARTGAMASYAIHVPLTKTVNIGLGVGMGVSNFSINDSKVKLSDASDDAYQSYLGSASKLNFLDVQSGFVMYNDRFYLGISGTQLLRNQARFRSIETESNFERHWYFMGSYRIDLGKTYAFEPVLIVKSVTGSPASFDAGARFHYNRMGWISLGYRGKSAFSAGFGINVLKQFRVAYAYEMGVSNLRSYGSGSHEIQIGIVLGHRRNMEKEFREQEKQREKQKLEDPELKIGTE